MIDRLLIINHRRYEVIVTVVVRLRIQELLEMRGENMAWLAHETRMSYQAIHALTRNRRRGVDFTTIEKLCIAFGCQPGDLIELLSDQGQKVKRAKTKRS